MPKIVHLKKARGRTKYKLLSFVLFPFLKFLFAWLKQFLNSKVKPLPSHPPISMPLPNRKILLYFSICIYKWTVAINSYPPLPIKVIRHQPQPNNQSLSQKSAQLPSRLTADHKHMREPCWDQPGPDHISWTSQTSEQNKYLLLSIVCYMLDKIMLESIFPLNVHHWSDPIYLLVFYW